MSKITPERLARQAVVYIRQSTTDQVANNLESKRRQYGLADRARQLGWADVAVIDDDLGRSGGVSAPKQRNTEDEKKAIKDGRIPEDWQATDAAAYEGVRLRDGLLDCSSRAAPDEDEHYAYAVAL